MKFKKVFAAVTAVVTAAVIAAPVFAGSEADRYIKCSVSRGGSVNLVNIERYIDEEAAEPVFTENDDKKYGLKIGKNEICKTEWDDIWLNTPAGRLQASMGSQNPNQDGYYSGSSLQGDFESNPETVSVKRDGKWGAVSKATGEILIEPQYNEVCEVNGIIRIMDFKGNYGYAAKDGRVIIEPKYDYVSAFSRSQLADFDSVYSCYTTVVGRDYGYTVLNLISGKELIPLTTDTINILNNDYFTVTNEDEYVSRLYDGGGNLLFELKDCSGIEMVRDDRFLAAMQNFSESESGERTAVGGFDVLIDSSGNTVLDGGDYYSLSYVSGGDTQSSDMIAADRSLIRPVFFACGRGSETTKIENGDVLSGFDLYDTDGRMLRSVEAGDMSVNCGTVRVYENGKWGLAGTDGRDILPCEYDAVNFPFVLKDGKVGAAANTGEMIVDPIWETDSLSGCRVINLSDRVFFTFRAPDGGMYLADTAGNTIAGPYTDISAKDGRLIISLPVSGYKVLADVTEDPIPVPVVDITAETSDETADYLKELDIIEDKSASDVITKAEFLNMLGKASGHGDNNIEVLNSGSDVLLTEGDALSIAADYIRACKKIDGVKSDEQIFKEEIEPYIPCYMPIDFAAESDKISETKYALGIVQAYELSVNSIKDEKLKAKDPIENIIAYYFY